MQLPLSLQMALEEIAATIPLSTLRSAYSKISQSYRRGEDSGLLFRNREQILAYLLARMPATYAAVFKVLASVQERLPDWRCSSVLDLGAGPGTASWAACEVFPTIDRVHLFERSAEVIEIGKKLALFSESPALKSGLWNRQDLTQFFTIPPADLTILSYVLAETDIHEALGRIWDGKTVLALIEPGTPDGFARIIAYRKKLIEMGAYIVAPCPHQQKCPIAGWCHFPARIERTKVHKFLKEGTLGYEDEKFSYVVASPFPLLPVEGRVVANPLKLSGHVKLTLCTQEGRIEEKTITKKIKNLYKQARDAEWSSLWNPNESSMYTSRDSRIDF